MQNACDQVKAELSALIDGQLEEKVQTKVETHVADCQHCSAELNSLRSLDTLLGTVQDMQMPDLWDSIKDQMPSVCELMLDELSAFLDGELTPPAQEGVNSHLKECPPCLGAFNSLSYANQEISKSLILSQDIEVDLWSAIQDRLEADCALIRGEMSDYVDQEVTNERHRSITSHLVECPSCHDEFERMTQLGNTLRELYQPKLDEKFDLWPEVRSKLQVVPFASKHGSSKDADLPIEIGSADASKPNNVRPMRRRALAVAAAAAVSLGVLGWGGMSMFAPRVAQASPMSAEAYLIESAFMEPAEVAEAAVYEQN